MPVTNGILYQAHQEGIAQAHEIDLNNLKREIVVDKKWLHAPLRVAASSNELQAMTLQDFNNFEAQVLNHLADPTLKSHLVIKYQFGSLKNLNKEQLLNILQHEATQPSTATMGIVQLFNENAGHKILANFDLAVANGPYTLIDPSGTAVNPIDTTQQIITKDVVTRIDFSSYIKQLQQNKIPVTLGQNPNTLVSVNWPIHGGSASQQFGAKSLEQILQIFEQTGITMQVRALQTGQNPGPEDN